MDFQRTNQPLHMNGGGLTRYRSAPTTYFSSFLDAADDDIRNFSGGGGGGGGGGYGGDDLDNFLNRFMPSNSIRTQGQYSGTNSSFSNNMNMQSQSQFVAPMKQEQNTLLPPQQLQQQPQQKIQSNYSQVPPVMYHNQAQAQAQAQSQTQQQNTSSEGSNVSAVDNSYGLLNSVRSNRLAPAKMGGNRGENSNLVRYNSSPAGLFANINRENEYGAVRGMGNFGAGGGNNANANAEASFSSASRFHGPMDFSSSSAQATPSGLMFPISEMVSTGMGGTNPGNTSTGFEENQKNDSSYMSGFPVTSWDESAVLSDSFLKGLGDDDDDNKGLSNSNKGSKRPPTLLSHHLSLPNTCDELSAMETLMQDSVLCKLRAKRGCATHPRSIAERVRRTRISERMRKLQDLVPNMDKQTNTSDMLDLAVDYIKDLQKQVQIREQSVVA